MSWARGGHTQATQAERRRKLAAKGLCLWCGRKTDEKRPARKGYNWRTGRYRIVPREMFSLCAACREKKRNRP